MGESTHSSRDASTRWSPSAASGRQSELQMAARRALENGRGVLVAGDPGSGRTRFLTDVLGTLSAETRSRVWIADDLDLLGDVPAEKLAGLISRGQGVPLGSMALHRAPSPGLTRFISHPDVVRVELPPKTFAELVAISEDMLGGRLSALSLPSLIPSRGGIDLVILRAWLQSNRDQGALIDNGEHWVLTTTPTSNDHLRRLVSGRTISAEASFGRGAPSAIHLRDTIIDVIALAPGIRMSSLSAVVGELGHDPRIDAALERLEETGTITVLDEPGAIRLRLRDGLIEFIVPQALPPLRRRRLTSSVVDVFSSVGAGGLGAGELVAYGRYSLELHRPIEGPTLALAARASFRGANRELTHRLASAAVEADGGFTAELALAAADAQRGDSDAALIRLQRLVAETEGDLERAEAVVALIHHVEERPGDPSAALSFDGPADLDDDSERRRIMRGFLLNTLGDAVGAAALVEEGMGSLTGAELVQAQLVVASGALLTGRLSRGRDALDAAERLLGPEEPERFRVQMVRAIIDSFDGRIDEATERMGRSREIAIAYDQAIAQALCSWTIGGLHRTAGRSASAVTMLSEALGIMDRFGMSRMALLVRADLAMALAVTGQPSTAREVLAPALDSELQVFNLVAKSQQSLGWIELVSGDASNASVAFRRAAEDYDAAGHSLPALAAFAEAARTGAASSALPRVAAMKDSMEGAFAEFSIRNITARARLQSNGDAAKPPPDGEAMAREFHALGAMADDAGLHMDAAEAYWTAANLWRGVGESRSAAAADRLCEDQMAACLVPLPPSRPQREERPTVRAGVADRRARSTRIEQPRDRRRAGAVHPHRRDSSSTRLRQAGCAREARTCRRSVARPAHVVSGGREKPFDRLTPNRPSLCPGDSIGAPPGT